MGWIKRAAWSSVLWTVFLFIFSFLGIGYIKSHPLPGLESEGLRLQKIGEVVGFGLFLNFIIWFYEYFKSKRIKH